jgi:hypothetical protein
MGQKQVGQKTVRTQNRWDKKQLEDKTYRTQNSMDKTDGTPNS